MPIVSGFTPINPPRPSTSVQGRLEQRSALNEPETQGKAKAPRKRKTQAAAPGSATKVDKATGPRKSKKSGKAHELQCQDISKSFTRTKPVTPGRKKVRIKSVLPLVVEDQEEQADAARVLGALTVPEDGENVEQTERSIRSLGIGDSYQATYAKGRRNGPNPDAFVDDRVPSSMRTVAGEDVFLHDAMPGHNGSSINPESLVQPEPWNDDSESFADFVVPQSAQGEARSGGTDFANVREEVRDLSRISPASSPFFDSDDIFEDQNSHDEFPMDDDGLEEIMQSITSPAPIARADLVDDWRPNFFDDDFFLDDVELTDDFLILPHAKPCSDNLSRHVEPKKSATHEEDITSLPSQASQSPCVLIQVSGNAFSAKSNHLGTPEGSENCFDDDDLDEGLAAHSSDVLQPPTPLTSPEKPTTPKLQWMPPKMYTPGKSSQVPVSLVDVPHLVPTNANGEALPFLRPPFPELIRDRSPILGLSNRTVLRTCFRIGEALNAAAVASRVNTDAIVELYARVVSSERENEGGLKQFFQFGDLFTDKPPYLSATYSLWKGVGLWNLDSKVFLGKAGKGKLARIMGRIKRRDKGGGCEMTIMSIWEVDWEDVGAAKGIVCS